MILVEADFNLKNVSDRLFPKASAISWANFHLSDF